MVWCIIMNELYNSSNVNGSVKYTHRRVWEEHFGKIPDGFIIHHKNGDKNDNRIENLILMTRADHMSLHASIKRGEKWNGEQLTEEQKRRIKHEYYLKNKSHSQKRSKKYYEEHRKEILKRVKEWRKNNLEKRKKWLNENRDRLREQARLRYLLNKEKRERDADSK